MLIAQSKKDQNEALIDPWTFVHFAIGLAAGLMGVSTGAALAGAVIYEAIEAPLESGPTGQKLFNVSKPESPGNQVVDVLVFAAGHAAGAAWNKS
jgi:hypothetical protein